MFKITAEMIPNKDKLSVRDVYKPYKQVRKLNKESYVNNITYLKILDAFLLFVKELILEGRTVELPGKLGTFCVTGRKPKFEVDDNNRPKLPPDWGATNKLWKDNPEYKEQKKIIYHFNEHSCYIRYKLQWSKPNIFLDNKNYYSFIAAKPLRRQLAKNIKSGIEYFVLKLKLITNE